MRNRVIEDRFTQLLSITQLPITQLPIIPDAEMKPITPPTVPPAPVTRICIVCAILGYAALLTGFLWAAHFRGIAQELKPHFGTIFVSFALLLAPYWAFGFGLAKALRSALRTRWTRAFLPAILVLPYLLSAIPERNCRVEYLLVFAILPVAIVALFEIAPPPAGMSWQDGLVLLAIGLPVEFGWLRGAWPQRGLSFMPKLLLMDALLYAFLVVRRVPETGFDFRPRWRDLIVGVREWAIFAPIAILLGLALRFIRPHEFSGTAFSVAAAWLITFFFVALPEELFFRGLLQNLIEKRLAAAGRGRSRLWALAIASPVFGLSHFNKPGPFNWRYVLLATIAGVFYGRAWRDRGRLLCSSMTHATVDVVWSVWFR